MKLLLPLFLLLYSSSLLAQEWKPVNGVTNEQQVVRAFEHATIFYKGDYLQDATILIKDELIQAVGVSGSFEIPSDAVRYDLTGRFIWPSFIEIYSDFGIEKRTASPSPRPQLESKKQGPYYYNESIHPEERSLDRFTYEKKLAQRYRKMGFGVLSTIEKDGVVRGRSALIALHDEADKQILKADAAMHYSFFKGSSKQSYPSSLMGMIALIRQLHHDARWYAENPNQLDYNESLEAVNQHAALPKILDAGSVQSVLRAQKLADEFDIDLIIKGDGNEYQRIEEIKAGEQSLILPLTYPKPYEVSDPFDAMQLSLSEMKEWELADYNSVWLEQAKIPFAFTADGLKSEQELFEQVERSIAKGLSRENAIAHFTSETAKLLQIEDLCGSLEKGKLANFLITTDSLFKKENQILSNWVRGTEYVISNAKLIAIEGDYSLNIDKKRQFDLQITKKGQKYIAKVGDKGQSMKKASLKLNGNRISLNYQIDSVLYRLSGSISDDQSRIWSGKTLINQQWLDWAAIRKARKKDSQADTEGTDSSKHASRKSVPRVFYPNMAYGWDSLPSKSSSIVFRNATVWTNEAEGIKKNYDVVIHDGKIKMVDYKINLDIMFPLIKNQLLEIDLKGKHLTSGIIDEHSHIAISRGVNESGEAVTAEVRIGDVINSEDINIYRQLAGGVTASQLLHGSANPIGGQSALIKLRWGKSADEMKIDGAAGFIKFALGENVKQSNWGDRNTLRFPQTRMGVEQVFYDAFNRAKIYQQEQQIYDAKKSREKKKNSGPRRDLELEALAQILDSQRFITCHSYIQSEVNMLMHVADSMGFSINTFTHILEGYKLADKLKAHGAAASTFSDWWAYKFEVNDAIPYNGAILHEQGVLTGFNSDDAEMGRRLNQEAAKAVKYGGVSQEEAWKFVTLNPAKMLHLDDRMGSIKEGKDADLVIWSDNPLSVYAMAEQTYIDGILYFDRQRNEELTRRNLEERERLIKLMIEAKGSGSKTQKVKPKKKKLYHCDDLEQ